MKLISYLNSSHFRKQSLTNLWHENLEICDGKILKSGHHKCRNKIRLTLTYKQRRGLWKDCKNILQGWHIINKNFSVTEALSLQSAIFLNVSMTIPISSLFIDKIHSIFIPVFKKAWNHFYHFIYTNPSATVGI